MWFKKKETHIYGNNPVALTGRYYIAPTSQTKFVEIIKDSWNTDWVPSNTLYEIKYEL